MKSDKVELITYLYFDALLYDAWDMNGIPCNNGLQAGAEYLPKKASTVCRQIF